MEKILRGYFIKLLFAAEIPNSLCLGGTKSSFGTRSEEERRAVEVCFCEKTAENNQRTKNANKGID